MVDKDSIDRGFHNFHANVQYAYVMSVEEKGRKNIQFLR